MKLPRDLSGRELTDHHLPQVGLHTVHQVGSHIILETELPASQRIAIPAHKALRIGTLNGILRAVAGHKRVERERILEGI